VVVLVKWVPGLKYQRVSGGLVMMMMVAGTRLQKQYLRSSCSKACAEGLELSVRGSKADWKCQQGCTLMGCMEALLSLEVGWECTWVGDKTQC